MVPEYTGEPLEFRRERFVTADFSLRATSFLPENYVHRRGRKGPTVTPIWEPSDSGIESF